MPVINGCKYSCEPCIRGHRATSCAHTDRILIEIRKPGRPLESCGHYLNACQCGRLTRIFSAEDVLQDPSSGQFGNERNPKFIVITPATSTKSSEPKIRVRGQCRVSKKSKKKSELPSTSHLTNRSSHDPSNLREDSPPNQNISHSSVKTQDQSHALPLQSHSSDSSFKQPLPQFLQPNSPPYPVIQRKPPMKDYFMQYQVGQNSNPHSRIQVTRVPQRLSDYSTKFSSRIEDVTMAPNTQLPQNGQDRGQPLVRSQYVLATWDSIRGTIR